MGERRGSRGVLWSDEQILAQVEDVDLMRAILAGRLRTVREHRWALQRLAREECVLAGFGGHDADPASTRAADRRCG